MARTVNDIFNEYLTNLEASYAANGVMLDTSTLSKLDVEYIVGWIQAVAVWALENLFDLHKTEVSETLATQKPHTLRWYAEKAQQFQYSYDLHLDEDYYNNEGLTEQQITESKVIAFASCEELQLGLRIKVAALDNGELAPVPAAEFQAFKSYMERVKDAGVHLEGYYVNEHPDSLKATLKIGYNPLVLSASGKRLDGTNDAPVQDAIDSYLKNLSFNGLFSPMRLTDYVQEVEGVYNVQLISMQAKYGLMPWADVGISYRPFAGYLRFNNPGDLILQFEPSQPV